MRSDPIHPAELGGTLFVPATHYQLEAVLSGDKYPRLRSLVVDLEDGIGQEQRHEAETRVLALLPSLGPTTLLRFVRPDSPQALARLLASEGIENIDGFVLPKFSLESAGAFLLHLHDSRFAFMPSVEGAELFSTAKLQRLADTLQPFRERIPTVRFGLEDMLRQLGMVRDCDTPLYELLAPAQAIGTMITVFKPMGFNVSGGVYKCFKDTVGFRKEVQTDLKQGLLGKTIIHPSQIEVIEAEYRVTPAQKEQADRIVGMTENISSLNAVMLEKSTQLPWADTILKRAALYGIKP